MADHDLISAAAATLAELRGALPEELRTQWEARIDQSVWTAGEETSWVCDVDTTNPPAAEFIARTSSPDLVEAVEGLLRAIANQSALSHEWIDDEIEEAVVRLAAAIERRPAGPQGQEKTP